MDEATLKRAQIYVYRVLNRVDKTQAKRYAKLMFPATKIATLGILRHFRSWKREVKNTEELIAKVDSSAVREIIDDATQGIDVYSQTDNDSADGFGSPKAKTHRYN